MMDPADTLVSRHPNPRRIEMHTEHLVIGGDVLQGNPVVPGDQCAEARDARVVAIWDAREDEAKGEGRGGHVKDPD